MRRIQINKPPPPLPFLSLTCTIILDIDLREIFLEYTFCGLTERGIDSIPFILYIRISLEIFIHTY